MWNFHEKDYGINRTELLFILTPAAVGLMICMLLRIIMFTVEDSVPETLYDRYPILVVVIPAILLLSLLSILYGVKLFQDMIYWNREKSGRFVLKKQISSLQEAESKGAGGGCLYPAVFPAERQSADPESGEQF